jgi:hypothetical protein
LPAESPVRFVIKDFDLKFDTALELGDDGYLDPVVYNAFVKFGETYLYHDNLIVAFFMHQVVKYEMIIVENSIYFVGQYMFTHMLGPVLDEMMNHYRL